MKKLSLITLLSFFISLGMGMGSQIIQAKELEEKEVTLEQAQKIALKEVKGKVLCTKEENDDGMAKYEIMIEGKDGKYEVEIDKATGKVLEVEKEGSNRDDDDDDDGDDYGEDNTN